MSIVCVRAVPFLREDVPELQSLLYDSIAIDDGVVQLAARLSKTLVVCTSTRVVRISADSRCQSTNASVTHSLMNVASIQHPHDPDRHPLESLGCLVQCHRTEGQPVDGLHRSLDGHHLARGALLQAAARGL